MLNNLNLTGWSAWEKPNRSKDELVNYSGFAKKMDSGTHFCVLFESLPELIRCVVENQNNNVRDYTTTVHRKGWPREWNFGNDSDYDTWEKTIDALESGRISEKYISMVEKEKFDLYQRFPVLYDLDRIAVSHKRRRKYSEGDGELDIDRYMSNDPNMFMSLPKQAIKDKAITICIDIWGSCGTSFAKFVQNIVFATAVTDIIEKAGIAVELIISSTAQEVWYGSNSCTVAFVGKRASEPLDLSKTITYGLSGLLRAVIFDFYYGWQGPSRTRDGAGYLMNNRETAISLEPFNPTIIIVGDDGYTQSNKATLVINKLKQIFSLPTMD